MLVILLMQSAAAPTEPPPVRFDVLVPQPKRRCEPGEDDEIVVCGARDDPERYRLRPLPERYEERPVKAEIDLSGIKAAGIVESAAVGNATSNRFMVRFKIPF